MTGVGCTLKVHCGCSSPPSHVIFLYTVGAAQSGSFTAIMGPSGCGKTSLLDCMSLRTRTYTGAIRLNEEPIHSSFFHIIGELMLKTIDALLPYIQAFVLDPKG